MLIATPETIIRPEYNAMKAHGVWDRSSYDKDPFFKDLRKEN
ncbi:MAG: hypothetical protein AAF383_27665 [Cyanobacteria bacterium P01_A01_bin.83]